MRELHELLQITLHELRFPNGTNIFYYNSICNAIRRLSDITYFERQTLVSYIHDNHPDIETYYNYKGESDVDGGFWYPPNMLQPRIDWLNEHIELNK